MSLSDILRQRIEYVASFVKDSTNQWLIVKYQIIIALPKWYRSKVGFSRRHYNTQKILINEVDREVMAYWKQLTGVTLVVPEEKLHDPNWVKRPKGWALNGGKEKLKQEL